MLRSNARNSLQFTADRFLLLFYPTLWSALLSIVSLIIGHAILPPERKRLNDILGEALKGLAEGVRGSSNVQTAREPEVVAASDVLEDAGPDGAEEERHDEREEESATSSAQTAYSPPIQPAGESVSEKKAEAPVKATTYRPLVTLLPVIREHYSTALHGITYDPMSTRRLRPILTILYALIGRNPIVKTMAKNPNGAFSFELQPGGGKEQLAESLSGIRELIALGIEDSLRAIRESYDWHQDDSVSRPRLGGPLGFWQNHFAHHSRAVRKESDPLDPRRRVAQTQEALLSATWAYEHDLFTWLETGFFTLTPGRGMEITERDLKDRSRRDMARTLFVREKVRGRRGRRADSPNASGDASESDAPPSKTPLSKADLAKVQNERVKAAAWLVAILDVSHGDPRRSMSVHHSTQYTLLDSTARQRCQFFVQRVSRTPQCCLPEQRGGSVHAQDETVLLSVVRRGLVGAKQYAGRSSVRSMDSGSQR